MGITLIQGGESVLADRAIASLLVKNPQATVTQLECSEIELGAITDALAPSLFGEDRILVLREIQELAQDLQDEVTEFLSNPDPSVELVLWHKGGVKGKALLDKIKKLKPEVIAVDAIKKDGEKAQFVHDEFARAASQLASDVASGKTIDVADVEKFQQGRVETTGFDVADATLDGKTDLALITLRQALTTGVDPVLITSALASSIRTLAKVSGSNKGVKSFELASSLGLPPWQIDKARRQLQGWTPATLSYAVVTLAEADAQIKGAAADPGYALERAILEIARAKSAQ